jgi:hypothetical protein
MNGWLGWGWAGLGLAWAGLAMVMVEYRLQNQLLRISGPPTKTDHTRNDNGATPLWAHVMGALVDRSAAAVPGGRGEPLRPLLASPVESTVESLRARWIYGRPRPKQMNTRPT